MSCLHRLPSSFKCGRSRGSKRGAHMATSSWHWRLPQLRPSVSCSGENPHHVFFLWVSSSSNSAQPGQLWVPHGANQPSDVSQENLAPMPAPPLRNNPQNIKTYRRLSNLLSEVRNKNWKPHHKPGNGGRLQRKAHVSRSARTSTCTRSDALATRGPLFSNCCLAWEAHKRLSDHRLTK